MATLDDKLLGEKLQYYCSSSSESEGEDEDDAVESDEGKIQSLRAASSSAASYEMQEWQGTSTNTGPKGVIKDFQRYKQLEREKREEQKAEYEALTKKLAITCRTKAEDEKAENDEDALDQELSELLGDDFIEQFIQQRMKDMMGREASGRLFGTVEHLKDGEQYLKAVDNQDKETCVLVLLFEPNAPGCTAALRALDDIARDHPRIKFCSVRPSAISMSANFRIGGVPALLSYRAGQVTGNFVKFTTDLGFDFESSDLESFLVENGVLNDRSLVPQVARNLKTYESSDSD